MKSIGSDLRSMVPNKKKGSENEKKGAVQMTIRTRGVPWNTRMQDHRI